MCEFSGEINCEYSTSRMVGRFRFLLVKLRAPAGIASKGIIARGLSGLEMGMISFLFWTETRGYERSFRRLRLYSAGHRIIVHLNEPVSQGYGGKECRTDVGRKREAGSASEHSEERRGVESGARRNFWNSRRRITLEWMMRIGSILQEMTVLVLVKVRALQRALWKEHRSRWAARARYWAGHC